MLTSVEQMNELAQRMDGSLGEFKVNDTGMEGTTA
jgi:hypothetical protein